MNEVGEHVPSPGDTRFALSRGVSVGLPRPIREITQVAEIREAAQRWVCIVSKGKLAGSVLAHISLVSWCNNEPCIKACNTI